MRGVQTQTFKDSPSKKMHLHLYIVAQLQSLKSHISGVELPNTRTNTADTQ